MLLEVFNRGWILLHFLQEAANADSVLFDIWSHLRKAFQVVFAVFVLLVNVVQVELQLVLLLNDVHGLGIAHLSHVVVRTVSKRLDEVADLCLDQLWSGRIGRLVLAFFLFLHELHQLLIFVLLSDDELLGLLLDLGQDFHLLLMVLAKDVVVHLCALVLHFVCAQRHFYFFAPLLDFIATPKVELVILEQLLAVGLDSLRFGLIWVALVVVDDFVQLLLQLQACLVHPLGILDDSGLWLDPAEIGVHIDIGIANVLFLEWQQAIQESAIDIVFVYRLQILGASCLIGFVVFTQLDEALLHLVAQLQVDQLVLALDFFLSWQPLQKAERSEEASVGDDVLVVQAVDRQEHVVIHALLLVLLQL